MKLGIVIGNVVLSISNPSMKGKRLLLIQPIDERENRIGDPLVAADVAGCGSGEKVFYVTSKEAAFAHGVDIPFDACVLGVVDRVNFSKVD